MAFDAGMLSCVCWEILEESEGARVEKVYQPDRDEIHIQIRSRSGGRRLLINAGSTNSRIGFTKIAKENPQNPPMLCVLLRKHLQGARLTAVEQLGFERAVMLTFDTRDEMGFDTKCYLVAELMGKYSNLIFLNAEKRIVSALRTVDFTTSSRRQVLPGMLYELPPKQDKQDPMTTSESEFLEICKNAPEGLSADKLIMSKFCGISSSVAREISHRACGEIDVPMGKCPHERLWKAFSEIIDQIKNKTYTPTAVLDGERAVEYSFCELTHYSGMQIKHYDSPSELLDEYFEGRDRETRVRQRASDILKIITNAEIRLTKKLEKQHSELADCKLGAEYKKQGDLIKANLYAIERGQRSVELTDYESYDEQSGEFAKIRIDLDTRLSPAANAQRLYKKYSKCKTAEHELAAQIEIAEHELEYVRSVADALARAENASDLADIRDELYESGYASKMKNYRPQKKKIPSPCQRFRTSEGYTVLCGKNNIQNEHITFEIARKNDYWFHVKGSPGSHTVMLCDGEEPNAQSFTEAAEIAAYYSSRRDGVNVPVDYTLVKNVKKVPASTPGLVIYHTNWTAYVTPTAEKITPLCEIP